MFFCLLTLHAGYYRLAKDFARREKKRRSQISARGHKPRTLSSSRGFIAARIHFSRTSTGWYAETCREKMKMFQKKKKKRMVGKHITIYKHALMHRTFLSVLCERLFVDCAARSNTKRLPIDLCTVM